LSVIIFLAARIEKDRQHNGQKKKDKRTNNDIQNIHMELEIEPPKQGYVVPKVKYLKCCILYQRKLPFVFTGSLGRGEVITVQLSGEC
jgi:hypothetical protein